MQWKASLLPEVGYPWYMAYGRYYHKYIFMEFLLDYLMDFQHGPAYHEPIAETIFDCNWNSSKGMAFIIFCNPIRMS